MIEIATLRRAVVQAGIVFYEGVVQSVTADGRGFWLAVELLPDLLYVTCAGKGLAVVAGARVGVTGQRQGARLLAVTIVPRGI